MVTESPFEQLAELPRGPVGPRVFAERGASFGMTVLGPPLAMSNPCSDGADAASVV